MTLRIQKFIRTLARATATNRKTIAPQIPNRRARFCWGLGSVIGLATDELHAGRLLAPRLEDWPRTGLPWVVFWLKELIHWGTLEPSMVAEIRAAGLGVGVWTVDDDLGVAWMRACHPDSVFTNKPREIGPKLK